MEQEIKLSQWHSGKVKPVRKGPYQRLFPCAGYYSYYSGGFWYGYSLTVKGAVKNFRSRNISGIQESAWRGIVK